MKTTFRRFGEGGDPTPLEHIRQAPEGIASPADSEGEARGASSSRPRPLREPIGEAGTCGSA